jgi:hypothetical protein
LGEVITQTVQHLGGKYRVSFKRDPSTTKDRTLLGFTVEANDDNLVTCLADAARLLGGAMAVVEIPTAAASVLGATPEAGTK